MILGSGTFTSGLHHDIQARFGRAAEIFGTKKTGFYANNLIPVDWAHLLRNELLKVILRSI